MSLFRHRRPKYRRCSVPTCDLERDHGATIWCRDHSDAIMAEMFTKHPTSETARRTAERLGVRRWVLIAEVDAEIERRHVEVLESIMQMSPEEKKMNRRWWKSVGRVDLPARVDELVSLEGPTPCPECGTLVQR